jgi:YesN/AraC family two-component response regulator
LALVVIYLYAISFYFFNAVNLLLIDVKMPQMNGFELYQEIKIKVAAREGRR